MDDKKMEVLKDFVVVKSDKAKVDDAIEIMQDAGKYYALVPEGKSRGKQVVAHALVHADTHELSIPTGQVVVRWGDRKDALEAFLKVHPGHVVKDYGKGGIVAFEGEEDPFAMAKNLAEFDGIVRASPMLLRKREFRLKR